MAGRQAPGLRKGAFEFCDATHLASAFMSVVCMVGMDGSMDGLVWLLVGVFCM